MRVPQEGELEVVLVAGGRRAGPLEVVAQVVAELRQVLAGAVAAASVGARGAAAAFAFVAGEARAVAGFAVANAAARALAQRVGPIFRSRGVNPGNLVRAHAHVAGAAGVVAVAPVGPADAAVGGARPVARAAVRAVRARVVGGGWGRGRRLEGFRQRRCGKLAHGLVRFREFFFLGGEFELDGVHVHGAVARGAEVGGERFHRLLERLRGRVVERVCSEEPALGGLSGEAHRNGGGLVREHLAAPGAGRAARHVVVDNVLHAQGFTGLSVLDGLRHHRAHLVGVLQGEVAHAGAGDAKLNVEAGRVRSSRGRRGFLSGSAHEHGESHHELHVYLKNYTQRKRTGTKGRGTRQVSAVKL